MTIQSHIEGYWKTLKNNGIDILTLTGINGNTIQVRAGFHRLSFFDAALEIEELGSLGPQAPVMAPTHVIKQLIPYTSIIAVHLSRRA